MGLSAKLPRKLVIMHERGRITIPEYMRKKLEISGECALWLELYPNDEPTSIIIKKA